MDFSEIVRTKKYSGWGLKIAAYLGGAYVKSLMRGGGILWGLVWCFPFSWVREHEGGLVGGICGWVGSLVGNVHMLDKGT